MKLKPTEEKLLSRMQFFFITGSYVMTELFLLYLFPPDLSYRHLKITAMGYLYTFLILLPVLIFGAAMLWFDSLNIYLTVLVLFLSMGAGILSPFLNFLYPGTVSETAQVSDYLVLDELPADDLKTITDFFPEALPAEAEALNYHYFYSREGLCNPLELSLTLGFSSEEEFRLYNRKTVSPSSSDDTFIRRIDTDVPNYKIHYFLQKK